MTELERRLLEGLKAIINQLSPAQDDMLFSKREALNKARQLIAEAELAVATPDADGWIPWNGGECPVDPGALVNWRCAWCASVEWRMLFDIIRKRAGDLNWSASDSPWRISAYRIAKS